MRIDLHAHSTASDGTDTPAEVVRAARASGVDVLALTDHDTTSGWDPASAALVAGQRLITGTEFSCVYTPAIGWPISLHLLGYLFDPAQAELRAERVRLRESRLGRARLIVEHMIADGLPITWPRVAELAAGGSIGRPHIGRALVEAGVVPDVTAAFAGPLSSRSGYYVPKRDLDIFRALALVDAAGGVSVFAHPLARRRGPVLDDAAIHDLADAGLGGLEVDHPDHSSADRAHLRVLARDRDLIVTGSSDYHGTNKTTPLDAGTTAEDQYRRLVAQATGAQPITG